MDDAGENVDRGSIGILEKEGDYVPSGSHGLRMASRGNRGGQAGGGTARTEIGGFGEGKVSDLAPRCTISP